MGNVEAGRGRTGRSKTKESAAYIAGKYLQTDKVAARYVLAPKAKIMRLLARHPKCGAGQQMFKLLRAYAATRLSARRGSYYHPGQCVWLRLPLSVMPEGAGVLWPSEFKVELAGPGKRGHIHCPGAGLRAGRTIVVCTRESSEHSKRQGGGRESVATMLATMLVVQGRSGDNRLDLFAASALAIEPWYRSQKE